MDPLVKVNVGSGPNDGTGDPLRDAFIKLNKNVDALVGAFGAAGGFATLGADGRLPIGQFPAGVLLPTTAHDLNTYTAPGTYYQGSVSAATLANNYPVASATGFLLVDTFGTATLQQFNTRVAPYQQFWRIKTGTGNVWSAWKEVSDATTALTYQGGMAAAQDLNTYTQRGVWIISSSAIATGGTNFPIGQSGVLLVYSAGYPGGTAATGANQVYIASNTNRQFFRSLVGGAWSAWREVADVAGTLASSLLGAASGVATLDGNVRLAQQHAFSEPLAAGTDANSAVFPGFYYVNSDAQATAALNWPVLLAGTLEVEAAGAGNLQITQVYTTRNGTGGVMRRFVRVRFGPAGTWGTWQEIARQADITTMAGQITTLTGQMAQTLGVGQSMQNVLASRASGVNYTNTTGRPIIAYIRGDLTAAFGNLSANVNGAFCGMSTHPTAGAAVGLTLTIPTGATYICAASSANISSWTEYR